MIEVLGVSKSFGSHAAVTDVSFTVPPGAVTAFVGPNGAGKSTVLRMIAGLTRPDAGEIRVNGSAFSSAPDPASTMGVFLSAEWIPPQGSARGFLQYACESQGLPRRRVDEALDLVGLGHVADTRVRSFSLGMRQRLGIAVATIGHPAILTLDEPVNALDPDGINWFRGFVTQAAAEGTTVLLSSHHMSELSMIADHVVMIESGRVVSQGSLEQFVATQSAPPVYIESPDLPRTLEAFSAAGLAVDRHGDGALVRGATAIEVGSIAFAAAAGLSHLVTLTRSLEETYFDLLSGRDGRRSQ